MKKLLTALLAVLLFILGAAYAQAEGREDFIGYWELDELMSGGRLTERGSLSFNVVISIREDGLLVFSLDDAGFFFEKPVFVPAEDGKGWICRFEDDAQITDLVIDETGRLHYALLNGERLDVWMIRTQPPENPMCGEWTVDHAYRDGQMVPRSGLKDIGLKLEADGFGMLTISDKQAAVRLAMVNGAPELNSGDGEKYAVRLNGDAGTLEIDMEIAGGEKVTLVLVRVEQQAAAAFRGGWHVVGAERNGEAAPLSGDTQRITLAFSGEKALLTMGESSGECAVTYAPDTDGEPGCTLKDGSSMNVQCTINAQGQLVMEMKDGGNVVRIFMERDEATERTTAAENPFNGLWNATISSMNGEKIPLDSVGLQKVTLEIRDGECRLTVNEDAGGCAAAYEYGPDGVPVSCTLRDNSSINAVCTIDESGVLYVKIVGDAGTLTLHMERVTGSGEQETPAAKTDYNGKWVLAEVQLGGATVPAEQSGLAASLNVSGESARFIMNPVSMLGVTSVTDAGLTLTGRDGEYLFVPDGEGQLQMKTERYGIEMTLIFIRE